MAIFKVENITKIYNPKSLSPTIAIKDIDLTINAAEFVAVMGPSGSGKTTLLNILTGIDKATSGEIIIDGIALNELTEQELAKLRYQKFGYIYQDFNLVNELSIFSNIAFPLMLNQVNKKEAKARISQITKELGVFELLNKYPNQCSGGQLQRISIARALINRQNILVADEPTGDLDSKNSEEVIRLLKKINEQGVTILLVTHDAKVAAKASRLIYINDGKIFNELQKGNKEESCFYQEIAQMIAKSRIGVIKDGTN